MKSGIISINLHTRKLNYGAVLHSWFFQKLLMRRYNISDCDVIDYVMPEIEKEDVCVSFANEMRKKFRGPFLLPVKWAFRIRYAKFERFFREHMKTSAKRYTHADFEGEKLPYDILFFESDVIWSPKYFNGSFDPAYFGALPAMNGIKKIAYSASMGDAQIGSEHEAELRRLLKYPDAISMRETYATKLVAGFTDKAVADVVDPVLLAQPEDFDEITAPRKVKRDYVLLYFPIKPTKFIRECAERYAKKRGLKVVESSVYPWDNRFCRTYASAGVEEFVSLVRNASAVFCNSLHGVCLSLIFHKEFYACERSGGQKYQDLCNKFGVPERYVTGNEYRELAPLDWEKIEELRQKYRAESLAWLDERIAEAAADIGDNIHK